MFVAERDYSFCHLNGIEAMVFPEDLKLASLAHANDSLVIAEAGDVACHDDGQFFEALGLCTACHGNEIGWN